MARIPVLILVLITCSYLAGMEQVEQRRVVALVGVLNKTGKGALLTKMSMPPEIELESLRGRLNIFRTPVPELAYVVNKNAELEFFKDPILMAASALECVREIVRIISHGGLHSLVVRVRLGEPEMRVYDANDIGEVNPEKTLLQKPLGQKTKVVVELGADGRPTPRFLDELNERCMVCWGQQIGCVLGCCGGLMCSGCADQIQAGDCPQCRKRLRVLCRD